MALAKREEGKGGGYVFADIKGNTGEILVTVGKDPDTGKPIKESYASVSGLVTDLDVKENELGSGDKITNLRIKLEDPGEKPVMASVALGSFFSAKIVGLLNAADLSKPIQISVGMMKQGDIVGGKPVGKDTAWVIMRQDGQRLVEKYGTPDNKLPEPNIVKVSGKEMKDMEPVNAAVAEIIQGLFTKIQALHEQAAAPDDHGVDAGEAAAAAEAATAARPSARG